MNIRRPSTYVEGVCKNERTSKRNVKRESDSNKTNIEKQERGEAH